MWGRDYLGGANYGELIIREHPEGWAAGFILNTNDPKWPKSNMWPVIEKLAATGRCPRIRVHAMWEDNHQYNPGKHDRIINRELLKTLAMRDRFPGVEWEFSPFCERGNSSGNELFKKLAASAKGLTLVNSVYKSDLVFQATVKNEVHGPTPKPRGAYNYSTDGSSAIDIDIESLKTTHKDASTFYFWVPQDNGRLNTNDKTARNARKAFPFTGEFMDSIIFLSTAKGKTNLTSQHIYKTHADQHSSPEPEPRAGKPVLITRVDSRRVDLVADNGQVVGSFGRTGKFTDGRPLYRGTTFGYLLALKAIRIQGHPVVKLVADGKVIGTINPGFRDGSYR